MKATEARKIVVAVCRNMRHTCKVTARTVSFQDLARADAVFVKVRPWTPEVYEACKSNADAHGFLLQE